MFIEYILCTRHLENKIHVIPSLMEGTVHTVKSENNPGDYNSVKMGETVLRKHKGGTLPVESELEVRSKG